jgi:DNA repair protein RadC
MAKKNSSTIRYINATVQHTEQNTEDPNQSAAQPIPNFFTQEESGNYVITKPLNKNEIIDLAKYIIADKFKRGETINNFETAKNYFFLHMANFEREVFGILFLDNDHKVICYEDLFFGTINRATVYPREVARKALKYNAAAIIIVHNHISASAIPSVWDEEITIKLKETLNIFEIRVLDHVITSGVSTVTFSELGLM